MSEPRQTEDLDRNLALELVRVTEAAAMAAGRWVGRGDKEGGDGAAVDAMRQLINSLPMRGHRGHRRGREGQRADALQRRAGRRLDSGGPEVDVAVDPIDGTTLMSKGMPNAIAVLAVAERGAMFDPSRRVLHGEARRRAGLRRRHRHRRRHHREPAPHRQGEELQRLRASPSASSTGRGTPSWSTRCARPAPGSGSSPTATSPAPSPPPASSPMWTCWWASAARPRASSPPARSSASAAAIQAKLWPRDDAERERAHRRRATTSTGCCTPTTWSRGDNVFFVATGVTGGDLLRGVRYRCGGAYTQSIVMRSKSGTIRVIDSFHRLEKLRRYSVVDFDGRPLVSESGLAGVRPSSAARRRGRSA